jgi:hypothetical protein
MMVSILISLLLSLATFAALSAIVQGVLRAIAAVRRIDRELNALESPRSVLRRPSAVRTTASRRAPRPAAAVRLAAA